MTVPFAGNSEFHEAVALLVDLQSAICEEDEERADALRDALDIRLNHLPWEANEWLRGLSGDLDMLCDQEVFEPNLFSASEYKDRLFSALRNMENDPESLLLLLRKEQNVLPPHAVAYARGRSYTLLSFQDVGTSFLRRAVELNPHFSEYKVILLGNLWSGGKLSQAMPLAETILSEETNPETVLIAAGVMGQALRSVLPNDRSAFGKLRRKIEAAFHLIPPSNPNLSSFGFALLGLVAEALNRQALAKKHYTRACLLTPEDGTPFLLRGRLMLKLDKTKALADFRHAINLGAADPFASLVLAREALVAGHYSDCQALCRLAIQSGSPIIQGQAYEMMAISEAYTHGEAEAVEHYFEEANKLFPSSSSIKRNMTVLKQAQKGDVERLFDLPDDTKAADDNLLDLTLWARSKQLWPASNPLTTPLGIAA